jgi:uncharacterized membrane protein (GlpM family)
MLAIKLLLVPGFLLLISLASARWGASIGGWLAGLPVVAGPILYILAVENGPTFAALAASASLSAVLASLSFSIAYAHAAPRVSWPIALLGSLSAWLMAAKLLSHVSCNVWVSGCIAFGALLVAPFLFPKQTVEQPSRAMGKMEMSLRMLCGACLTLSVSMVSGHVGAQWSGLLSVFPVLGIVLAVFSHRNQGAHFSSSLLRSMSVGLYSFATFCLTLAIGLQRMPTPSVFLAATLACLVVQFLSRQRLTIWSSRRPQAPLAGALRASHSGAAYRER